MASSINKDGSPRTYINRQAKKGGKMLNSLLQYVRSFLLSYGYSSISDFAMSLCPSFKYNLQIPSLGISTMFAVTAHWLGIGPIVAFAMFVAVIVETATGILASEKRGENFESFRFSRCVLKVFIWFVLVFIVNCFSLECAMRERWWDTVGAVFFDIVRLLILAYFVVEYIVSILENLAVLDGKPKTEFIVALKGMWKTLVKRTRKSYGK